MTTENDCCNSPCARGTCKKHYNEWRKKRIGDPETRPVNLTSWIPWKQH